MHPIKSSVWLSVALSSITAASGILSAPGASKPLAPQAHKTLATEQPTAPQVHKTLVQDAPSVALPLPELCYAPGTDLGVIRRNARQRDLFSSLQAPPRNFQYFPTPRWTTTMTDGSGLTQGQVTTLTWNIVADGTPIGALGGIGTEVAAPSNLKAFLNGIYGNEATWTALFQSMFDQWSAITGVTYVKVNFDDGIDLATAAGSAGVRADLRIGGHFLDGPSNVLAYNFSPNNGDMVIDTGDTFYNNISNGSQRLINVIAHEHGHGIGLAHSCPVDSTKLMEPFVNTAFTHAQLDDKLGAWRQYGDDKENNETSATASNLGSLGNGTTTVNDLSLDDNSDVDFYKFTVPAGKRAAVTVTPIGNTYLSGPQVGGSCSAGTPFNALTLNDVGVELRGTDGIAILGSANDFGPGTAETVSSTALTGGGTFFVRAFAGTADNVQGYRLDVTITDDVGAFLAINNVTLTEGTGGTTNAVFTVTRSGDTSGAVSVSAQTANNTAVSSADYTATGPTVLNFGAGVTTQTFTVPVVGDITDELDETFFVNLTSPVGASLADGVGLGTILDDDGPPTISINDVSVAEGNAGTTNAIFTASLSAASGQTVTVNYATADGTATVSTSTVPFSNAAPITIPTTGSGATTSPASPYPSNITVSGVPSPLKVTVTLSGFSHTYSQDVDVLLVGPTGQTVVLMSDVGGTSTSSNLSFTFDDAAANALGTGTLASGTFRPTNNNDAEGLDAYPSSAPAGPYGSTLAGFNGVNANGTWALYVVDDFGGDGGAFASGWSLSFQTLGATSDYAPTSGTLTFAPGETAKTINVPVQGDAVLESNETFFVNLSAPTNATIADAQGLGTIIDDDGGATLSINDITITEGDAGTTSATFTVTRAGSTASTTTVSALTAAGTATAGTDFTTTGPTVLTFNPGVTTQTFTVPIVGDLLDEPNEGFFVNLSAPTNATISDSQGQGTITDNDPTPSINISNPSFSEGNAGSSFLSFSISLSAPSGQTVTVTAQTADGTASSGSDYASAGPTVFTFTPGQTSKSFDVNVFGDTVVEENETFFANLTSPTNATLAGGPGVATIVNDDLASRVFVSASGSDANACSNQTTPCRSIAGAIAQTLSDGEVIVLTPGEYETAPLNITKGVKVTSPSGTVAFIRQPITVNAPGARVVLRGLTLKGNGTGTAVTLTAADSLSVEETTIDRWTNGLSIPIGFSGSVFVFDSVFRSHSVGLVDAGIAAAGRVSITDTRFEGNTVGLAPGGGEYSVRNSAFVGNGDGIEAFSGSTSDVQRCEFSQNSGGVLTFGSAILRIGRSHVFGNGTGLDASAGGTLASYGTNVVRKNGTNTLGSIATISEQ